MWMCSVVAIASSNFESSTELNLSQINGRDRENSFTKLGGGVVNIILFNIS